MAAAHQPEMLTGPTAWAGDQMRVDSRWQFELTSAARDEIDGALKTLRDKAVPWDHVRMTDFNGPAVTSLFRDIAHELENGSGVARLAGIPVQEYEDADCRRLVFGLAGHIGTPLFQTARGELMGVITDEGANVGTQRGQMQDEKTGQVFLSSRSRAQSTAALRWHTDRCDVVGLLCIHPALRGGVSRLASAVTISNLMIERRPDLAQLLYQDIPRSRLGEEAGGENCHYLLPVFSQYNGLFSSHYSRTFVEAGQKNPSVPKISFAQWEALDMLAQLADEVSFEMTLRPGDLQWVNNHVIYHGRTPFEDFSDPGMRRRLLRVWLSAHDSRALDDKLAVLWGQTKAGALRGGMCQSPLPGDGLQSSYPQADQRVPAWFLSGNRN